MSLERIALTPTPLAFALKLVNLVSPHMSLVLLELLPLCWGLEQVSFVCAWSLSYLQCLGFQQPFVSLGHSPCWFSQPDVMGTPLPNIDYASIWEAQFGDGSAHSSRETSVAKISLLFLFLKRFYLFIFREREREGERGRESLLYERNIDWLLILCHSWGLGLQLRHMP